MMNILYYNWTEVSGDDLCQSFSHLGHSYTKIMHSLKNYDTDHEFSEFFTDTLHAGNYDVIFTFDYFPIISNIAQKEHIPYISWIYDSPHYTLYSDTLYNSCNRIFFFDREQYLYFKSTGLKTGYHMPLAVNTLRLNQLLGTDIENTNYMHDISFVGKLYEVNMYNGIRNLPDYLKGYIDGLIDSQKKIYGYNLIYDALTPDIMKELSQYITFSDDGSYIPRRQIFTNMINIKITELERTRFLNALAKHVSVDLYTGSDTSALKDVNVHGFISYTEEMPKVFRNSKINLNITLRSIHSGIPLRAIDIMGCGGFLLSNWQPELAEYFIPDQEVVLYDSEQDLLDKALYYLKHDDERKQIAKNGYEKVQRLYSYEHAVEQILSTI